MATIGSLLEVATQQPEMQYMIQLFPELDRRHQLHLYRVMELIFLAARNMSTIQYRPPINRYLHLVAR